MQLTITLRNALSALHTLHIRGDEARVFTGAADAIASVIHTLEKAELEMASDPMDPRD